MQGVGQPDIVVIEDLNPSIDPGYAAFTAQDEVDRNKRYLVTLLDVHCVADECKSDTARKEKEAKLKITADALSPRHNVTTRPITIGTRVPLTTSDIYKLQEDLGISKEQAHKLYRDIWLTNTYYLQQIQSTYYKEQHRTEPLRPNDHRPSIPRRPRPDHVNNI